MYKRREPGGAGGAPRPEPGPQPQEDFATLIDRLNRETETAVDSAPANISAEESEHLRLRFDALGELRGLLNLSREAQLSALKKYRTENIITRAEFEALGRAAGF